MTQEKGPARGVALGGFMGAGKTTVGGCLAKRWGVPFVDLDLRVAEAAGCSVPELFEREGEAGFRAHEAGVLAEIVLEASPLVLALGGGTLHYGTNLKTVKNAFDVVVLHLSWDRILNRLSVSKPGGRPLMSDAARLYAERLPGYLQAGWWVDGDAEPEEVAERVVARLLVR